MLGLQKRSVSKMFNFVAPDIIIPDCTGNHLTEDQLLTNHRNTLYFTSIKISNLHHAVKLSNWTGVNYVNLSTEHYFKK